MQKNKTFEHYIIQLIRESNIVVLLQPIRYIYLISYLYHRLQTESQIFDTV